MQGIGNRTKIHQNKYAFAHNPNSKKSARIMGIPNVGLCQRCHDIIEWRKKFRKYKPIKNMTKCDNCQEKKVRSAYHNWCTDCARASNVCPKCLLDRAIVENESAELTQEAIQEMLVQVGMKERIRRKIWRLWENNKCTDAELKDMILNYNPDAKEEPEDEEEQKSIPPTNPVATRGPPPKPKAAPVTATSSTTTATSASTVAPRTSSSSPAAPKPTDEEDENEEDDGEDYLDDDDDEEDDEEEDEAAAAELARQQASKRGPPPKPKSSATLASVTKLEQAVAATAISSKDTTP